MTSRSNKLAHAHALLRFAATMGAITIFFPTALVAAGDRAAPGKLASGIVELARRGLSHDAETFSKLTGVMLRNPNKWSDQSMKERGDARNARWINPPNGAGVLDVVFHDMRVGDGREIAFSANLELTGRPCVTIRYLERAAGMKATYGGIVVPIVWDGPPPPAYTVGKEQASLSVLDRYGRAMNITMVASKSGSQGCLKTVGLSSERPAAR